MQDQDSPDLAPANPLERELPKETLGAGIWNALSWVRDLVFSVLIAVVCIVFIYQPVKVEGTSMMPGLTDQPPPAAPAVAIKIAERMASIRIISSSSRPPPASPAAAAISIVAIRTTSVTTRKPMRRAYCLLDVFTETPLAGNPLAVVLDGDGLDDARMQAIRASSTCPRPYSCSRRANP